MKHKLPQRLILLLASTFVTVVAAEVVFRLVGREFEALLPDGRDLILQRSTDPDIIYELRPNTTRFAWGTDVVVNSHGFRGAEPAPDPYSGRRIIVVGDSIAFGNKVPHDANLVSRLQSMLDPQRDDVEVLNFAVGGYDTVQEVAVLEQHGLAFNPDAVVVVFCLNDVLFASANMNYLEEMDSLRRSILFRSVLVRFLALQLDRIRHKQFASRANDPDVFRALHGHQIDPIDEDETALLELMEQAPNRYPARFYSERDRVGRLRYAFRRLAGLARDHDFRVIVVIVPFLVGQHHYPYTAVHQIVEYEAERVGFELIDPTPSFVAVGMRKLRTDPSDRVHPSVEGHEIIARELVAALGD